MVTLRCHESDSIVFGKYGWFCMQARLTLRGALHTIQPDEVILFIILRVVLFMLNLTSRPKRRMHFNNVCELDVGENILTQERESDKWKEQKYAEDLHDLNFKHGLLLLSILRSFRLSSVCLKSSREQITLGNRLILK
jgi:hypothetical protein